MSSDASTLSWDGSAENRRLRTFRGLCTSRMQEPYEEYDAWCAHADTTNSPMVRGESCRVSFLNPFTERILLLSDSYMAGTHSVLSGSVAENRTYCTKDGDYFESGVQPTQGGRNDLEEIKRRVLAGDPLWEIITDNVNNGQQLRFATQLHGLRQRRQRRTAKREPPLNPIRRPTSAPHDHGSGTAMKGRLWSSSTIFEVIPTRTASS